MKHEPSHPSPDLERRALEIFERICDEDDHERSRIIQEHRREDPELGRALSDLLTADSDSRWFPRESESSPPLSVVDESSASSFPVLRDYTIREEIARGGMGVVYRGEQLHPVRRAVAIKVLRPGLDSIEVRRRFELEQRLLARMNHPSIAQVYGAGSTDCGRPFVAMELVEGESITDFCRNHGVSPRDRISLVRQVCDAVTYAHQRGVIHRDLKPSNILVTKTGDAFVPKVIDFGIAKAVAADADPFGPNQAPTITIRNRPSFLGTPEYMSPEQILGSSDIDVRTDVFALGILLRELLLGEMPEHRQRLRRMPLDSLVRFVENQSEPLASQLAQNADPAGIGRRALHSFLRGDLDWILQRALESDRSNRYESVQSFASDLLRFLEHRPVEAGPPDVLRRVRKALIRHRWLSVSLFVIFTAIAAGAIGVVVGLQRVQTERRSVELLRYQSLIQQAQASNSMDSSGPALAALEACPEANRHWEWQRLALEADTSLAILRGPDWMPTSFDVSPCGAMIAAGTYSGRTFLWRADDPDTPLQLTDEEPIVSALRFSPDSERIVRGFSDGRMRIDAVGAGAEPLEIPDAHGGAINDLVFDLDGSRMFSASADGTLRVWETQRWSCIETLTGFRGTLSCLTLSRDGSLLAAAGGGQRLYLWDVENMAFRREFSWNRGAVVDLVFSADGESIYATAGYRVQVWNVESGAYSFLSHVSSSLVRCLDVAPDGDVLAIGSFESQIVLWDLQDDRLVHGLSGHHHGLVGVEFASQGGYLASISTDETVRMWDPTVGAAHTEISTGRLTHHLASHPASTIIATLSRESGSVSLWKHETGEFVTEFVAHPAGAAFIDFKSDGSIVTVGYENVERGDTIAVWSPDGSRREREIRNVSAYNGALTPDRRSLVVVGWRARVTRVDLETGEISWTTECDTLDWDTGPKSIAVSNDYVAIGGLLDGDLPILDLQTGEVVHRLEVGLAEPLPLIFHPTRPVLVYAMSSGKIAVLDLETQKEHWRFAQPTGKTTDLAISADGNRLFAATFEPEAGVLVWDLVNGLYLARLSGDDSSAMSLELLAGDTRLALTTRRGNLIFYETRIEPLRRMAHHASLRTRALREIERRIPDFESLDELRSTMAHERDRSREETAALDTVFATLDPERIATRLRAEAVRCLISWNRPYEEYARGASCAARAWDLHRTAEDRFLIALADYRTLRPFRALKRFLDLESRLTPKYGRFVSPLLGKAAVVLLQAWHGDPRRAEDTLESVLDFVRSVNL